MYEIYEGTKSAHEENGLIWYEINVKSPTDEIVHVIEPPVKRKKSLMDKLCRFCINVSVKSKKDFTVVNIFYPFLVASIFTFIFCIGFISCSENFSISIVLFLFTFILFGNVLYEFLRVLIPILRLKKRK